MTTKLAKQFFFFTMFSVGALMIPTNVLMEKLLLDAPYLNMEYIESTNPHKETRIGKIRYHHEGVVSEEEVETHFSEQSLSHRLDETNKKTTSNNPFGTDQKSASVSSKPHNHPGYENEVGLENPYEDQKFIESNIQGFQKESEIDTVIDEVPPLDDFAIQVRGEGVLGLWAEGYFAYKVYSASWGQVPNTYNTASYASIQGFSAFFIHNYLGGDKLYRVPKWVKVALIRPDQIEWYVIDGTVRYRGTPNGKVCGYKSPYVEWEQELGRKGLSAERIATWHYQKPFAIQTSICSDGKVGVHILTGTWTSEPPSEPSG